MIIAVDFDGTCVTHEFPYVGKEIGAAEVLKEDRCHSKTTQRRRGILQCS